MTRPRSNKPRKIVCSTYLIPSIKQKFYDKCEEQGLSPSETLRRFVYEYIDE